MNCLCYVIHEHKITNPYNWYHNTTNNVITRIVVFVYNNSRFVKIDPIQDDVVLLAKKKGIS